MTNPDKYYLFYDGDCGFCNHWVQWILENDTKKQFMFSALQSEFGQRFLNERNLDSKQLSTLYLWKPESFYYTKSKAAFEIANILGGKFKLISYLKVLPASITDFFYEIVAKHRQKLATNKCFLPSPEERTRFVEK